MTASVSFSFLRRYWIRWLLGLVIGFPLLLLAVAYWWILPSLPAHKDTVARLLSAATGYTISLERIEGEWGGARPRIALDGIKLSAGNRPLLHFSRLEGRFGWRSLLTLEPRFHDLKVSAPAMILRRAADGMYYLGGLKIDPDSKETGLSDWLLKQGKVSVEGATLAWIDEASGSPPLVLRNVSLDLQNLLRRHAFSLTATPPPHVATPFRVEALLLGSSLSAREEWHGTLTLAVNALSLETMRPWLPASWSGASGHGTAEISMEIDQGRLESLEAKLNMAGIHLALNNQRSPLSLDRLSGKVGWKREPGSQTVWGRRLVLKSVNAAATDPFDLAYRWGGEGHSLLVKDMQLDSLPRMTESLPLDASLAERIRAGQPYGRLEELVLTWQGDWPSPSGFSVQARFSGLGWLAQDEIPGVSNVSGSMRGTQEKGVYAVSGNNAGFDLPKIFSDPVLKFETLNLRGGWKKAKSEGVVIEIAEAALSNADLSANFFGQYHWFGKGPGVANLNGRLDRATGARVVRYLPLVVNEHTRHWLEQAILGGVVSEASFQLQGDLTRFPFHKPGEGIFRVKGTARDVQLKYADNYPLISHIDGELVLEGPRLEIHSDKASIYGVELTRVKAWVANIEADDVLLDITGEASGPAQEFIRFVNFSPVTDWVGGLTEEMTATGNLDLTMNIKVPLGHSQDTTLAGRLGFKGNTVFPGPDLPRLEEVTGSLEFTEATVGVRQINARVLGGEAVFSATTESSQVRVRGQGLLKASALDTWVGKEIASRLAGQTGWKGELSVGKEHARIRLESNLIGMESRLPAPMNKGAAGAINLLFERQKLDRHQDWSSLQYGKLASAVWTSQQTPAGRKLDRGELRFGEQARLPGESGLQVAGYVRNFDLGGWVELLIREPGEQTLPLSGVNLTLSRLDFLGRPFHDITIDGKLKGNLLRAGLVGREMEGNLTYRLAGESPSRLSVQFRHFDLPDAAEGTGGEAIRLQPEDMPAMDVQVEEFRLGGQPMGRLEVFAHGVPRGLAIDQLSLFHKDSIVNMTGTWNDTGKGETRMKLNADIRNAGDVLARFGYGNALRRGTAQIQGEVSWQGSPADFAFATLAGTLAMTAKGGQFTTIEPGAGKLLGVLSLQSLPRRLALDFRDVFSQGFAFDQISSTMQLAKGTVYTNDFVMKGPAATVKMSGLANLQDESVRLRVKVVPKLSEGVAVAGALLGGPVAGLGALVMQKALKDPLEQAISYEYLVDGSWNDPAITKLARPKPEKEQEPSS